MDSNDSQPGSKTVRMFYCLVLKDVIPHNPTVGRTEKNERTLTDEEWEEEFCDSVNLQLEELLEPMNCQSAFDRKTGACPLKNQQSTYLIPFLVSKLHEFKADDIIIPKPNYSGFRIEEKALSSVQETLAQDIRNALGTNIAIHELVFRMVTSRNFVFEIYYAGSFKVKREFTDDDIEYEGGVRAALESFFDEIESVIKPFQLTSTPSRRQRSRNNKYIFGVYYAPRIGFSESDVHGEGCYAISGNASTDEVNEYGIDFEDTLEDDTNAFLKSILDENLPPDTDLISSEISYIDDPEEAFDICNELICYQKSIWRPSISNQTSSQRLRLKQ